MLINLHKNTAYCMVAKTGSTTLSVMFMTAGGLLPPDMVHRKYYPWPVRKYGIMRTSLGTLRRKTGENATTFTRDMFKFVMVRNPLERFASAFNDKVMRDSRFVWMRNSVLKYKRKQSMVSNKYSYSVHAQLILFYYQCTKTAKIA